jgi:UDP-N-acetylmuramoylalanine--D-glutamate ligase
MVVLATESRTDVFVDARMTTEPNVLVLGMGATGTSCARYFASRNALVEFVDTRPTPPGLSSILEIIPEASIHVGSEPVDLPPAIEQIVVSPGVDMESPLIRAGRARGVEIVSDIDLFVDQCQAPIIAVTGSNGKSTVTSMVGVMLSAAGMSPATGGNLGTPALDLLDPDNDIYVLELSSFQLERSRTVPAAASVVLNLTVDHLDRHSDMKSYAAAKARIYNGCRHAVINRDAGEFASLVPDGIPVTTFGLGEPAPGDFGIRTSADGEFIAHGPTRWQRLPWDMQLVLLHKVWSQDSRHFADCLTGCKSYLKRMTFCGSMIQKPPISARQ